MNSKTIAIEGVLRDLGARDYNVTRGKPRTSKVSRWLFPNGEPLVLQTNCVVPRLWARAAHASLLGELGEAERYEPDRGKHSNLAQVDEFRNDVLVKVTAEAGVEAIRRVLRALGGLVR